MRAYQEIVELSDVPDEQMRGVLKAVLDHLHLEVVREAAPDYTSYEVQLTRPWRNK